MKQLTLLFIIVSTLLAQATTRPIVCTWPASPTPGVTGYNLLKSSVSGGPYAALNTAPITGLSFTDPAETIGATVFYVAQAIGPACTVPPTGPCGLSAFSVESSTGPIADRTAQPGKIIIIIQ